MSNMSSIIPTNAAPIIADKEAFNRSLFVTWLKVRRTLTPAKNPTTTAIPPISAISGCPGLLRSFPKIPLVLSLGTSHGTMMKVTVKATANPTMNPNSMDVEIL